MKGKLTLLAVMAACNAINAQTDTVSLDNVVVTGTRHTTDVRHLPMTVTVVDRARLTEQHQMSVLPTLMQQVPGLFVTSRGVMGYGVSGGAAGGMSMRGISSGGGQMLVLIDGHPQYNGVYGHPISDSYQTMIADRVEVLRGPASVLYGSNAMGGVINIVTRKMETDGNRTHASVGAGSYGTVQAETSNQARIGRFSSTVAGQYMRSDNHRPGMGFEQEGGYVKLGYDFSGNWNAYMDVDVTHFEAENPGSTTSPLYGAEQWITRGMATMALENHYDRTDGALSFYTDFGRHKVDDGSSDAARPTNRLFRSKDALVGVSWYQSARLFQGNRITVGADYHHVYGKAYYTSKATGEEMPNQGKQSGISYRNEIAAYADFRQDICQWLTVDAGIRMDHHSVAGTEWVPQAGFVVRPMNTSEVKFMAGKGFRNPTMKEMYLYPPSNEDLEPERIWNYELSWRHRLGRFNYGANVYYIKGDNMIQVVNRKNVNTGEIENYGFEVDASCNINSHWSVNTNHSFLHMEKKVVAAPEYKGFMGVDYRLSRFTANATLQYIHNLYTSVEKDITKENFCLLGVTLGYKVTDGINVWLRGENLLAQSYEINLGYPMPRATFMAGVDIHL